ncbi:MAG: hypothetical protein WC693_02370 [Patescibacteria group bacterium]|jgi:hypothetical protein
MGDLILRKVFFSIQEPPRMADLDPMPSNYGGVIFRADPGGVLHYTADERSWVVTPTTRRNTGLICFCYFALPADTSNVIGFRVKRINNNGTSVCVKPVFGTMEELLQHYNAPSGARQV